jgi:ribosomal protein L22
MKLLKIKSIKKVGVEQVYDIINVSNNKNYIGNSLILHNSAAEWAKKEHKTLKKKLAQIRTKHLLFILCWPLKIYKVEKNYLESFVNYWIELFGRGVGSIFVKDMNPVHDTWRLDDFKRLHSYNEFTNVDKIEEILKKHPNFWQMIQIPKPSKALYEKYLQVRESNVYDETTVMENVTKEDVYASLLILTLKDLITQDSTLSISRISLHIKNTYDIALPKDAINNMVEDSKQLITKIRKEGFYK